jgi:hypothetical protein
MINAYFLCFVSFVKTEVGFSVLKYPGAVILEKSL